MSTVTSPIILDSTGLRMATALESIATAQSSVTLTITMKGTNNVQASGEQVIIKSTTTGAVIHSLNYNGAPVTVRLARDTAYTITGTVNTLPTSGFYYPSTAQGVAQVDTAITITYQVISGLTSLAAVQAAVQANPGVEVLPIGTEITIPYVCQDGVTRDWKWAIVYYGYFVKESDAATGAKTWGCILWATQSTDVNVQFDNAEIEEAMETYAIAGLYYYGKSGDTITKLTVNTGDELPKSSYDVIYHNDVLDTSANIVKCGYNNYGKSAIRQWINSDAAAGGWWTAQHIGDSAPAQAELKGMLHGFRAEDKAALTKVAVHTVSNSSMDGGIEYVTYDKMFIPSETEMYGVPNASNVGKEGAAWGAYWNGVLGMPLSDDPQTQRIIYEINAPTTKYLMHFRTPDSSRSGATCFVDTYGSVRYNVGANYGHCSEAYRHTPACVIC